MPQTAFYKNENFQVPPDGLEIVLAHGKKTLHIAVPPTGIAHVNGTKPSGAARCEHITLEPHHDREVFITADLPDGRKSKILVHADRGEVVRQFIQDPPKISPSRPVTQGRLEVPKAFEIAGPKGTIEVWSRVNKQAFELRQVRRGEQILETWKAGYLMTTVQKGRLRSTNFDQSTAMMTGRIRPAFVKVRSKHGLRRVLKEAARKPNSPSLLKKNGPN